MQYQVLEKDGVIDFHSFIVERISLLDILRSMQCVLDKKSDQEHSNLQIEINPLGWIELALSDGAIFIESSITIDLQNVCSKVAMKFYLPATILFDLMRRLEVQTVQFLVYEKTVKLEYADGDFSLTKINANTRELRIEGSHASFKINALYLSDTLKVLKSTMANEDIRDQFKGISVILNNDDKMINKMILWSTDGIRMSIAELEINQSINLEGIWPRKFIETICSTAQDCIAEFKMYERQVQCTIGKTTILSPLINAKLLDYKAIMDKDDKFTVKIITDVQYFSKKLDRMMILAENEIGILFDINQSPTISCFNKQRSDKAVEKLDGIEWTGENSKFHLNGGIMLNFIRNFKGIVEILFYKNSNNIIVRRKGEQNLMYITKAMTAKQA